MRRMTGWIGRAQRWLGRIRLYLMRVPKPPFIDVDLDSIAKPLVPFKQPRWGGRSKDLFEDL